MIKDIFRSSLRKKLVVLLKASQQQGFSCGKQVNCRVSIRPKEKYGFTACIITNNASLGDVNGVYHFYASKHFDNFRSALVTLSEEVSETSSALPGFLFFRSFEFVSDEKALKYVHDYRSIPDREKWLFDSLNWDWRVNGVYVNEQFENGSWTVHVNEKPEKLDLLWETITTHEL